MKQWQFYSLVVGLLVSVFTLGSYGYNISAFAAGLASKVGFLEKRQDEDRQDIKENLNYIRSRLDQIYIDMQSKNQSAPNCGQCKDH